MPDDPSRPLVAVLGGGQLGRMLGLAGIPLGLRFRFLDPVAGAPAGAVGPLITGALDDDAALATTAAGADVVTYEWEGVPSHGVARLAQHVPVWPPARALDVGQDRLAEKQMFGALGIDTAPYAPVDTREELDAAVAALGTPAILKTRRGGYDGKGQFRLASADDAADAWVALGRDDGAADLILEGFVAFDRELSILAARGAEATAAWPVVENHHRDGILRLSLAPAPGTTPALQAAAESIASRVLDHLGYRGVLCVELFQVGERLLANELAPRVHNSGHWTIEGSETSQFEQHLRAVLGWPLGSTATRGAAAMVNCIGALPDRDAVLTVPGAHLHDYEKSPRTGRKVGHITVRADDHAARDAVAARVMALVAAAEQG